MCLPGKTMAIIFPQNHLYASIFGCMHIRKTRRHKPLVKCVLFLNMQKKKQNLKETKRYNKWSKKLYNIWTKYIAWNIVAECTAHRNHHFHQLHFSVVWRALLHMFFASYCYRMIVDFPQFLFCVSLIFHPMLNLSFNLLH